MTAEDEIRALETLVETLMRFSPEAQRRMLDYARHYLDDRNRKASPAAD